MPSARHRAAFRKLCAALPFALLLCGARGSDTNSVLNGWLAAQTNLHTWTADFIQTRTLKTLTQPLTATGHVWFASPNRFRWELGRPAQTIAIRQAEEMLVIYPTLKRAERYPLSTPARGEWRDALSLLEAGFPRGRRDLEASFRIESIRPSAGTWQLALQPRSASARRLMTAIRIGLATNDFSLVSTELVFADGSRLRNDFTNAVLNAEFDRSILDWKPAPDFKITEPLAK